MNTVVLAMTLALVSSGEMIADNSGETTAVKKPQRKVAPKTKARTRDAVVRALLDRLPKGWTVSRRGLPKGMLGVATGPGGEVFVVSTLEAPLDPDAISNADARGWLIERLNLTDGEVRIGDAFGGFELRARTSFQKGAPARAVQAWVVPGKPQWLVSWVGPVNAANRAEKRVRIAADRWKNR